MSDASLQGILAEVRGLRERRRTAQARSRLQDALRQFPNNADLLVQSAWTDYADDRNDAALATVRQALAYAPDHEAGRQLLFELQLDNGKLADAEDIIVELLRDHPSSAAYYGKYAGLMLRAAQLPRARALAGEGLKHDADDGACLAARTLCDFIEQRPGVTSHSLQQLLVRHPQSQRSLLLLLMALQDRGDDQGAFQIARELVRADPGREDFAQLAAQLHAATHWSMRPLWPLRRWGWGASMAIWLVGMAVMRTMAPINPVIAVVFGGCIITYAIYSWVWPPLLRRWMARA
jgi:tetratricopeptide (TPR) repeat protein